MPNLLAIESHVVHGYVGNRAATFPLQLRGWNVDALNTVNLSNHTGYGKFKGFKVTPDDIWSQYEGLKDINLSYDALLTGYTPSRDAVETVGRIGFDLKSRFPDLIWLLDPVLGDEGCLYVPQEVIPAYKNIMKSGAVSLITPNGFEVETLVGFKVNDLESIKRALNVLHKEFNVPNVVISSIKLDAENDDILYSIGSAFKSDSSSIESFYITYPALNSYFTGTGDLFAALLIDRFFINSKNQKINALSLSLKQVLAVMNYILKSTMSVALKYGPGKRGDAEAMKHMELQLINNRRYLMNEPENLDAYHEKFLG